MRGVLSTAAACSVMPFPGKGAAHHPVRKESAAQAPNAAVTKRWVFWSIVFFLFTGSSYRFRIKQVEPVCFVVFGCQFIIGFFGLPSVFLQDTLEVFEPGQCRFTH